MTTRKRIEWIDIARGLGIIFTIYGHQGFDLLTSWIYSFHMPLFFFLSGYLFSGETDVITFLKKKIKSLIIPYFFLGIPMIVAYIIQYDVYSWDGIMDLLFQFIYQQRFLTIWFITCLFVLNIVYYFINKFFKNTIIKLFIALVSLLAGFINYTYFSIILPWNADVCFMALIFFMCGHLCKNSTKINNIDFSNKRVFIACFVFALLSLTSSMGNFFLFGTCLDMYSNVYLSLPLVYFSAFCGIGFVCTLSKIINFKFIKYIGANSIIYFAWHQSIMFPFIGRFIDPIIKKIPILESILSVRFIGISVYKIYVLVLTIFIITIINIAISKTKLRFILGK